MAHVFIFRHGETTDNRDKIFSGWRQSDLTPEGIQEAESVAEKLKSEKVTKAYTSDLIRSIHTMDIVLIPHSQHIERVEDPRIKERDYGKLTGSSKTELQEKDPKNYEMWHRSYTVAPPGGESILDVERRVYPFLEEMIKIATSSDIIFISAHGNSIRPMRKFFEHMTNEEICSYEYIPGEIFSYTI